jgi:hypothetical protein
MGSVTMGVTYRTRLTLSPHKLDKSAPVSLKADHFDGTGGFDGIGGRGSGGSTSLIGYRDSDESR